MTPIGSCTLVCVLWFTQNRVVGSPEIPLGKEAPAVEKTFLSLLLPTWWGTYYRSRVKSRQISKGKKWGLGHVNAWPPSAYERFLVICPVSGLEAGLVPGLFSVHWPRSLGSGRLSGDPWAPQKGIISALQLRG